MSHIVPTIIKKTALYKLLRDSIYKKLTEVKFVNHILFNSAVREQIKNPLNIPIIIISFNQLHYLEQLIDRLFKVGHSNLVVIDNASTYKPLLDYLELLTEKGVHVEYSNSNNGHLGLWSNRSLCDRYTKGFYIVTDPDIVPLNTCPDNFVNECLKILLRNKSYTKVGLSLSLEHIASDFKFKKNVLKWEYRFWSNPIKDGYIASIDTTFALYRPNYQYNKLNFFKAIRLKEPFTAKHGGWLVDYKHLTPEQIHYISLANESSSWISKDGNSLTKKIY